MRPAAILLLSSAALCGCEERVVGVRGLLTNISGAKGGYEVDQASSGQRIIGGETLINPWDQLIGPDPNMPAAPIDEKPEQAEARAKEEARTLRRKTADGSVYLISRAPAHLFYHLLRTLGDKEYDLLYEQLLSERLKTEYRRRGRDPREAVEFLAKRRSAVGELLAVFPMAEHTPGTRLESLGANAFRMRVPQEIAAQQKFDSIEFVIEDGRFKLLLIQ